MTDPLSEWLDEMERKARAAGKSRPTANETYALIHALPPETVRAMVDCVRAAQEIPPINDARVLRLCDSIAHLRRLALGDGK